MSKLISCLVLILVVALAACGDNQRAPLAPDASVLDASVADARIPDAAARDAISLACSVEDLQPLFMCVTTNCLDFTPDFDAGLGGGDGGFGFDPTQILSCVAQRCGLLVFGLPPSCRTCVLSGLSGLASGSFDGVLTNCVSQPPPPIP
ncbi:MAG: hypothetical protein IT370_29550 [Deltaproteobacteria bacterium]|nr:hypothetical protein [Deltaproteobacteria bacterium]